MDSDTQKLILGLTAALCSFGVGYFLRSAQIRKLNAETDNLRIEGRKLRAEIVALEDDGVTKALEQFKQVKALEDEARAVDAELGKAVQALIVAWKKGRSTATLTRRRDIVCALLDKLLYSMRVEAEFRQILLARRPDEFHAYLKERLSKELRRVCKWWEAVNTGGFIQGKGMVPYLISDTTIAPFEQLGKQFDGDWTEKCVEALHEIIVDIAAIRSRYNVLTDASDGQDLTASQVE